MNRFKSKGGGIETVSFIWNGCNTYHLREDNGGLAAAKVQSFGDFLWKSCPKKFVITRKTTVMDSYFNLAYYIWLLGSSRSQRRL